MASIQSVKVAQSRAGLGDAVIREFAGTIRGQVITRTDPHYHEARLVNNAMIDRFPDIIVRCANAADVIRSVNFGRDNGLPLAVRGGGHNVAGFAVCDDGLVIDLSRMRGIRVNRANGTVRAEGGCTWGDLDHATHLFGLAAPGGLISTTGIAGLTLGGGIGHLTRKYGLSCDNLLEADIVTADGSYITTDADQVSDLFWGLRGGGGNFGVVTSFKFKLHPVSTVYGGAVFYPAEKSRDVLKFYRDYIARAPEDMNAFFAYLIVPPAPVFPQNLQGKTVCGIVLCHLGSTRQAEEDSQPIRKFGPPIFEHVGPLPFPVLQSMFDFNTPYGKLQNYWKADFVNELTDEAIDVHAHYGPQIPAGSSTMHLYPITGAASRVDSDETAFSYRDAQFAHVIAAMYPDPADSEKCMKWVRDYWTALHPHSAAGAYVNFMMADESDERIMASYGSNYRRLAELKKKYDPNNLFRLNQNIKPGV